MTMATLGEDISSLVSVVVGSGSTGGAFVGAVVEVGG